MNNTTVNSKMYMTYHNSITHPMQAIDIKSNMIIAKNPHLINSVNRSHNHPLSQKYSHIAKVENQDLIYLTSINLYLNK